MIKNTQTKRQLITKSLVLLMCCNSITSHADTLDLNIVGMEIFDEYMASIDNVTVKVVEPIILEDNSVSVQTQENVSKEDSIKSSSITNEQNILLQKSNTQSIDKDKKNLIAAQSKEKATEKQQAEQIAANEKRVQDIAAKAAQKKVLKKNEEQSRISRNISQLPFYGTYKFTINDKISGNASRSLTSSNNSWIYKTKASALFFASAKQEAEFGLVDTFFKPKKYYENFDIVVQKSTANLDFTTKNNAVVTNVGGKKQTIPANQAAQDFLSLETQVRLDLMNNSLKTSYTLVERNFVKKLIVKNLGLQSVSVPAGTFKAYKIKVQPKQAKQVINFYFAPSIKYVPVRITQTGGKSSFDFQLKSYK